MATIQQLFGDLERHIKNEEHDKVLALTDKSNTSFNESFFVLSYPTRTPLVPSKLIRIIVFFLFFFFAPTL